MKLHLFPFAVLAATLLAGCGGDAASPVPPVAPPTVPENPPPVDPPPVADEPSLPYWNHCEHPREGMQENGIPYPDVQGTLADEKKFLRLWENETYLWYKELPKLDETKYASAIAYFADLKTSQVTASGAAKDRFHFTYPTAQWNDMQLGVDLGYGVTWTRNADGKPPRNWRVAYVVDGLPAQKAGLRRGDLLVNVDGIDFINTADTDAVAKLNAAITPLKVGEEHKFTVRRGDQQITAALTSSRQDVSPVPTVKVLDTPAGKTGYLVFNTHNIVAEKSLFDAFTSLRNAQVTGLVLDLRYNGGGLLTIASELAYMVAGPQATTNRIFERSVRNDKLVSPKPSVFQSTSVGYQVPNSVPSGLALPYLGLKQVTVLTGPGTCSASESVINALRGIDITVNLVGDRTCGKPYAFNPAPNCGTTYFAIQFQGVNDKGFGDYGDGFEPTCKVADDYGHELGDKSESLLSAALSLRATGSCPAPVAAARARAAAAQPVLVPARPEVAELKILQ